MAINSQQVNTISKLTDELKRFHDSYYELLQLTETMVLRDIPTAAEFDAFHTAEPDNGIKFITRNKLVFAVGVVQSLRSYLNTASNITPTLVNGPITPALPNKKPLDAIVDATL